MAQSETIDYNKFIRSLITQLSNGRGDKIPDALVEMYRECSNGESQPSEIQLKNTLSRILEAFDSTYIIIDSLDECAGMADLLKWIKSVTSEISTKLHLMLTSRPEPKVERALTSLSNYQRVSITAECTAGDIITYLEARLQDAEMDQWDKPEKQKIQTVIFKRYDGMYATI